LYVVREPVLTATLSGQTELGFFFFSTAAGTGSSERIDRIIFSAMSAPSSSSGSGPGAGSGSGSGGGGKGDDSYNGNSNSVNSLTSSTGSAASTSTALEPIDEKLENENEMQRKELSRLLGSATDKDRKEMLEKAIVALDNAHDDLASQDSANKFMLMHSPLVRESVFGSSPVANISAFGAVGGGPLGLGKVVRPISAQRQRSLSKANLLLEVIPETTIRGGEVERDANKEQVLQLDDIADVQTSSCDTRFPPRGALFGQTNTRNRSGSFGGGGGGGGGGFGSNKGSPSARDNKGDGHGGGGPHDNVPKR
jgi:hypothetical protein